MRVPDDASSNVNSPLMSLIATCVDDARRVGRSYAVISVIISVVRPMVVSPDRNRVPDPIGPGVTLAAQRTLGLKRGSLRVSATKSNTSWIGRRIRISPPICVMACSFG
jgi:hypothetical protein